TQWSGAGRADAGGSRAVWRPQRVSQRYAGKIDRTLAYTAAYDAGDPGEDRRLGSTVRPAVAGRRSLPGGAVRDPHPAQGAVTGAGGVAVGAGPRPQGDRTERPQWPCDPVAGRRRWSADVPLFPSVAGEVRRRQPQHGWPCVGALTADQFHPSLSGGDPPVGG